jgi:sugar O-acyltransferase (sialic acid O-acetyltransferase NeuD family)
VSIVHFPRLLVIGAGGHARMCLEILQDSAQFDVVGAVSADGTGIRDLGIPVLGRQGDVLSLTETEGVTTFCVAIGDNLTRQEIHRDLTQRGWAAALLVSADAVISRSAELGVGCQIMPAAVVTAAASIGVGTIVNTNASIDHDARIGDFVHVAPGVAIGGDVVIGDRALIGLGARVLPGVVIGADVIVGAGAVVIDNVPDGATVVGVPARTRGDATT